MERNNELNLRVFKRNSQYLILLWNRNRDVPDKDIEIIYHENVKNMEEDSKWPKVEKLELDEGIPKENIETIKPTKNVVVCGINERANDIDPSMEYVFEVNYGKYSQSIVVKPSGVLPLEEREDKPKNRHLFGWNEKKNKWQKISVEETKEGKVAIVVKVVK